MSPSLELPGQKLGAAGEGRPNGYTGIQGRGGHLGAPHLVVCKSPLQLWLANVGRGDLLTLSANAEFNRPSFPP